MSEVYISNIEEVLVPGGHATGDLAQKVTEISSRSIWYGAETTVLPGQPDSEFVDYAGEMGRETDVLVPEGVDPQALSIRDGFADPKLQVAVNGKTVDSYIGDETLGSLVTRYGGAYVTGGPREAVEAANDKGRYAEHVAGVVDVPPGELAHGIDAIAEAVRDRLSRDGQAFVRHTRSGGGFGNRFFTVEDGRMPSVDEIKEKLAGGHWDLWQNGSALVEEVLNLKASPGVAFHTETGTAYDFDQITQGKGYIGCWSPVPPEVVSNPNQLVLIGNHLATRLGSLGFKGYADTDLGVTFDGKTFGFEVNGRSDGVRHAIKVGEAVWGVPWADWRKEGLVTKAVDHFVLRHDANFRQLRETMRREGVQMATPDDPFGAVISIPPAGNVAGVQVLAKGYRQAEDMYQGVLSAVGDPHHNYEDFPLFR